MKRTPPAKDPQDFTHHWDEATPALTRLGMFDDALRLRIANDQGVQPALVELGSVNDNLTTWRTSVQSMRHGTQAIDATLTKLEALRIVMVAE